MFRRGLYRASPEPGVALWGEVGYVDSKLTREEITRTSSASDKYINWQRKISPDNGLTWSEPEPLAEVTLDTDKGGIVNYPSLATWDLQRNIQYRFTMRRLWPGQKCYTYNWGGKHQLNDHVFVRENDNQESLLRYEEGPDYDPGNMFNPDFCFANNAYRGVNAAIDEDGTVFYPIICNNVKVKGIHMDGVCLMRRNPDNGQWTSSNLQFVDLDVSSRGLLEPSVAILKNGAVMVICRGSNTKKVPGLKWITVSTDSGKTISSVEELKYDDGSRFYSPSSIHHLVRSSRNGRLYWIANILDEPPQANGPRYPLCLAEIDEEKMAVCKESVLVIDDRTENDSERLQLSNFCVLEDRLTNNIEIYMTRIGENADDFRYSGIYKYIFSPA